MSIDPQLNRFPDNVLHIHLMGVCGTGMGALAAGLKNIGFHVTGSDENVYPPMSEFLAKTGIMVTAGYSPDNLEPRPDLVIVGNVIRRDNPEALGLADAAIPYVSFPQCLSHYFLSNHTSLVIAGTHGKTTTASLLAAMLHEAGLSPGFMIGGLVRTFGSNFRVGTGSHFVVEGDEYDTAFFDKGPKFLHYRPHIAVITSIEFDHADIYPDLSAIIKSFSRLVGIMPGHGCIVACYDDPVVRDVVSNAPCRVLKYGKTENLDFSLADLDISCGTTSFSVLKNGTIFGKFKSVMPGLHNALNALAVIATMDTLGVAPEKIINSLPRFKGIKRRQEVRGTVDGVTIIDDFAHHPTAVRETLTALRAAYSGQRLTAVFEPRTNSSRRSVFQKTYVSSFDHADQILIKEPVALTNIPENERFSARKLASDLCDRGLDTHHFSTTEDILLFLKKNAVRGDVIAILSNGGFDNIHSRLIEMLIG